MHLWRIGLIELAISPFILEEFEIVVHRPRIQQRYNLSDADITEYLEVLRTFTVIVSGTVTVDAVPDDPDDNIIIACAIESEADAIVSGDQHLLSLGSYHGIPIVKVVDFLSDYVPSHSVHPAIHTSQKVAG